MQTIIDQDAVVFAKVFPQQIVGFSNAKEKLDKKLATYPLAKYRTVFLQVVLSKVAKKESKHATDCKTPNCTMHRDYRIAVFTLTQELERTLEADKPALNAEDVFSLQEQLGIIQILEELKNEFKKNLNDLKIGQEELKMGQEILFEEIDSLRQQFSLGKKNWTQLLKGKVIDLVAQNILEKAVAPKVIEIITSSIKAGCLVLPG